MPVLAAHADPTASPHALSPRRAGRAFPVCSNPRCASGWLHLWRSRRLPVLEGGWLCSPACTHVRLGELLRREQAEARPLSVHRHRVPIGLVLLNQGWITHEHLRDALAAQRSGSRLRLGEWLAANRGLDPARLTQALGLQWSCPVFSLDKGPSGPPLTLIPRLLSESFGFVPLRLTSSGTLYLAFEDRIDHSLTLAVERMTGLQVESGLVCASEFRHAHQQMQRSRRARARLIEAASLDLLADAFTRHLEKLRPADARLVRLHDLFWLRLWRDTANRASGPAPSGPAHDDGFEDIIGSVVRFA